MYSITITSAAKKQLRRVHSQYLTKITTTIESLAADPRPDGIRMLQGCEDTYRIRVGTYRVVYEINDNEICVKVVRIAHRQGAYDHLH